LVERELLAGLVRSGRGDRYAMTALRTRVRAGGTGHRYAYLEIEHQRYIRLTPSSKAVWIVSIIARGVIGTDSAG